MRCVRFLLVSFLLVGCTDATPVAPDGPVSPQFAAADVGWTEGVAYDEWVDYAPCVGEDLHASGGVWYRYHDVVNGRQEKWNAQYGPLPDYQFVGMTTGQVWLLAPSMLHGVTQTAVFVAAVGEPFHVYKVTSSRFDFVNQTTGEKLSWPYKFHMTRNTAGEVTAYFEVNPCRLK